MIRSLVLVLAMAACAQGAEIDPQLVGPFVLRTGEPEPEPPPSAASSCGMAFDPAPELLAATESAAARWSAATGCDVRVEAGGVPLVILADVINNDGKSTRARTTTVWVDGEMQTDRIEYRADSLSQSGRIVPHEMGHALGGYGHTERGLMQEKPGDVEPIDAAALELVCVRLACEWMRPE